MFPAELFIDLAHHVATVMVLHALESLSDREAISALRRDTAWKVACGLRLDDEGLLLMFPKVFVDELDGGGAFADG
jgi:hypothetical protein